MITTLAAMPAPSDTGLVAAIVVAVCSGGGLTTLIQWLAHRGKSSAEEAEIWTRSSITRLKVMHEEMATLEERVKRLNTELDEERAARIKANDALDQERRQRIAAVEALQRAGISWSYGS